MLILPKSLSILTGNQIQVVGSFSKRTSGDHKQDLTELFDFCADQSDDQVNLVPQLLPPVAWYFGGSVQLDLMNSIDDLQFIIDNKLPFCLDISHAFMISEVDSSMHSGLVLLSL